VLERAGLVRRRVLGRDHYISLAAQPLRDASTWLDNYRAFLGAATGRARNALARWLTIG